jgi:hypothetical protein
LTLHLNKGHPPKPDIFLLMTVSVSKLFCVHDKMTNEYGAFGGMRIVKGNRSTRRKSDLLSFSPPQTPRDLNWDRLRGGKPANKPLNYGTAQFQDSRNVCDTIHFNVNCG